MSPELIGVLLAVLLMVPTFYVVHTYRLDSWAWTLILATLPVYYMLMGLLVADTTAITLELLYGLPYILTALAVRKTKSLLAIRVIALAWISHGFYDYYHDLFFVNPGVFAWYPAFCALIDVVVGGYLLFRSRHILASAQG